MDRSQSMIDREERLRMSNEGGDGPSQIPIMGGQDRSRLSEYQFLHQGPMDNWQSHTANRGQSLPEYNRFHPSLGAGVTWPGAEKFATAPLAHERDLDSLFIEGAALGEDTYIPSSGVIPLDLDIDEDIAENIDDEPISFDGSCGTESPIECGGR
ncbi:hypothetical protein Taro_052471 [Colocasia esculenta]|uniref:Uncharacterized protein n=1 Tax=Colocasia esculenta TaxID=4460 RepID=A0A843XIJ0_COLES|nr:hypothetical protein [Colocasia esculenta]